MTLSPDPFLLRALAKAAIVLCYQRPEPLAVHVSLWTTATGMPLTAANWKRLRDLKLVVWKDPAWQLTPESARMLRSNRIKFPQQLVGTSEDRPVESHPKLERPKLERIAEGTLTVEHVEHVRRTVLGVIRKNALHRAILNDCAGVLEGSTACRETVVRAWNALIMPIDELIENSSMGAAMRDIRTRGVDAHLKTVEESVRPKQRARRKLP